MACYARNSNWANYAKAMIYGAFAHAIEDLYGHMIIQPSRYGYGFAIDHASCINDSIQKLAETYHELFSGTLVTYSDYQPITYALFWGVRRFSTDTLVEFGDWSFSLDLYREIDGTQLSPIKWWQKMSFPAIHCFVDAANRYGYASGNLTDARLRAYLHGWGIILGLGYGYWPTNDGTQGPNSGGVIGHPLWTLNSIIGDNGHLYKMIVPHTIASILPNFLKSRIWRDVIGGKFQWVTEPYGTIGSNSWYSFFETGDLLFYMFHIMPVNQQTPERLQQMLLLRDQVNFWVYNAQVKKPNEQVTYGEELPAEISLLPLYSNSINQGSSYLDYNMNGVDIWSLSRKAGLVGGIYNPTYDWFYRQPGVINLGFKKDGNPIWTNIKVGLQGDPVNINFFYDLIPFGSTRLKVIGKTTAGNEIELLPLEYSSNAPNRWSGENSLGLQQQVCQNPTLIEIFFRVLTKNKYGGDYKEMFSSDYHQTFFDNSAVSSNPLYQQWFNYGEPIRELHQSPFQNPKEFWPYACSLKVVDWYLNSPHSLTINSVGVNKLRLRWFDASNWEGGYEIERTNLITQQTQLFYSNSYSQTGYVTWDDNNAEFGQLYKYRARAKRDNFYSVNWSNEATGSVAYSDLAYPTAFGNQTKVVNQGNSVHFVYYGYDFNNAHKIIYLHSNDGGNTWGNEESIPYSMSGNVSPSITLDQFGRPHILWLMWEYCKDEERWRIVCYHTYKDGSNWINLQPLSNNWAYGTEGTEPFSLPSIPFSIKGDTGYSAIVIPKPPIPNAPCSLEVFKFPLYATSYRTKTPIFGDGSNVSSIGEYYTNRPSLVIDGRRVVVCYSKYDDHELAIRWWSDSMMVTSCTHIYNPHAIVKGQNLILTWYSDCPDYDIKYAKCQRMSNGYTQPNVEHVYDVVTGNFPLLTAPRLIDDDLIIFHDEFGIYYSLRKNNVWNNFQIYNEGYNSNFCPQACVLPNLFMFNPLLKTFWTNGNNKHYLLCKSLNLPIRYYVACDMATGPNNGAHLMRVPNSKELYMVFQNQNKIYCLHSYDEGENWETEEIGEGLYPCIGLNYKGLPWIAYTHNGDLVCKIKRPDGTYQETILFHDDRLWAAQPSIALATIPIKEDVLDYAYLVYPVYDGDVPPDPIPGPPDNLRSSYIYITLFDTLKARTHELDVKIDPNTPLSHPCVAVTPADLIHITWQQGDEIWYVTNTEKVTPENWENVQWTEKYNLSNTPDFASERPFVKSYGDIVSVVWKEDNPGEIIRKQRYVWEPSEYDKWKDPENLSNSPEFNSDYPQMSDGDVVLWQETDNEGKNEVYANIQGKILTLTPEAQNASFVHANTLILDPKTPEIMVYYCYTDEITENELYEVKFDKYEYQGESGDGEFVYYEGKLGEEIASIYLESRDGYINYGNYKIDYGNNLKYKLKYLNPCKKYLFQGILYQCTTATIRQKLDIEDTLASDNTISYAIPETISFFIRPNSYKNDLETKIKINKIQGAYSVLSKFKLYEYETIDSTGGSGPQSSGTERLPIPLMLHSPKPNPFNNRTEIRFQIPAKTRIDVKIYNSAGRLVNTLVSDEMNPGYYTINWNGKDNQNRTLSKGIYFVRLKTKDFDATKKMVMVK